MRIPDEAAIMAALGGCGNMAGGGQSRKKAGGEVLLDSTCFLRYIT